MAKTTFLVLALGVAVFLPRAISFHEPRPGNPQMEAAFRDGLFLARFDAQHGREAHIASGRWSSDADRVLFIAGYRQGYHEFSSARSGTQSAPDEAELAGYKDGIADGLEQRRSARPFQPDKTDNYRSTGHGNPKLTSGSEEYGQHYRRAYSNGYQQGYYSVLEPEPRTVSQNSGSF